MADGNLMGLTNEDRTIAQSIASNCGGSLPTADAIYLAGIRAGMERAAKICDHIYTEETVGDWAAGQCADRIRDAMGSEPTGPGSP